MCGIAGVFYKEKERRTEEKDLMRMASMMRHRGPDGYGIYLGPGAGLVLARLSIIDIEGGWQPISNEDGTVWVVCNGEIFNYVELQHELKGRGHQFKTGSDVEVLLHLYEEKNFPGLLSDLNGQFAFCIYDVGKRRVFLARDRVGIHPLHYICLNDRILFASEAKALFSDPDVPRKLDTTSLDQVFTFWGPLPGRTMFQGIREVPPASYLEFDLKTWKEVRLAHYWKCLFGEKYRENGRSMESCSEEFLDLLKNATRIRLRADVPVGAYLSGGLDSSSLTSLIVNHMDREVETFSIGFEDQAYDEDAFQKEVVKRLEVKHRRILCKYDDIAGAIATVIWHTERPLIRTAAVPMYLLSSLVHDSGYRVVVTGEGADEFLGGYDIFKEALIRNFWRKNPESKWRSLLLKRLYPYFRQNPGRAGVYMKNFFGKGLEDDGAVMFSHRTRWETTSAIKTFYSKSYRGGERIETHLAELERWIPPGFDGWHTLHKAQYIEILILLSQYLLSSQGDRVAMANSVEARFPFLDPAVIDFSNRLPPNYKISGLNEKAILKRAMKGYLPDSVLSRSKQPYMAPDSESFFKGEKGREIVDAHLSEESVKKAGIFDPVKVMMLRKKCEAGRVTGFKDNMAFIGILTTQLFYELFLNDFSHAASGDLPEPCIRHIQ